jgi:hypothetical protein
VQSRPVATVEDRIMAKPERDDADDGIQERHTPRPRRPEPRSEDRRPRPARRPDDDYEDDDEDHEYDRPRRPRRRGDNAVSTIIPYQNGMALAGYYTGVFSLIPGIGLLLGPMAIIFGIVGLRRVRAIPEVKGTGHAITGIVLGSLTTLANWAIAAIIVIGIFSARR